MLLAKKASYVKEADALSYVAGFCIHNDVTERHYQFNRNGTWDKGKGCDTFAPIGPFLVTKDEISDLNNLNLWLNVNGVKMQEGNTCDLIFSVPHLISYVSHFMTLLPGDIISTGTPGGFGIKKSRKLFLKPGDVLELGIDFLGSSRQLVKDYEMVN